MSEAQTHSSPLITPKNYNREQKKTRRPTKNGGKEILFTFLPYSFSPFYQNYGISVWLFSIYGSSFRPPYFLIRVLDLPSQFAKTISNLFKRLSGKAFK
jgi:hypothetical protein